jgi:hypothetical protein
MAQQTIFSVKMNRRPELDPHFGQGINFQCIFYFIEVTPAEGKSYTVLLAIPAYPYFDGGTSVAKQIAKMFIEESDTFKIIPPPVGNVEIGSFPTVSFDPEIPNQFFWLTPPLHLRH